MVIDRANLALLAVQERVDGFVARCREEGLSVTPQRLAIFRALAASPAHPSAEVLHSELRESMPTISLATVYKTLETLTALGAIRPVTHLQGRMRYDAKLEPHHHLVCIRCQTVEDLSDERLDDAGAPAREAAASHGFEVRGHMVEIWGLCRACAQGGD